MIDQTVADWHRHLRGQLPGGLDELLRDDVVFYSPIVYTPQEGKAITKLYLEAAGQTCRATSPKAMTPRAVARTTAGREASDTRRRCSPGTWPCSSSRRPWRGST